jgi:hypothetical protein
MFCMRRTWGLRGAMSAPIASPAIEAWVARDTEADAPAIAIAGGRCEVVVVSTREEDR